MSDCVELILETAQVLDFVLPVSYRFARKRLNAISRTDDEHDENLGRRVVSPSGGGRGVKSQPQSPRYSPKIACRCTRPAPRFKGRSTQECAP